MGEEQVRALNPPVKEGLQQDHTQSVAAKEASAIPVFNTPIPAGIPKPKLSLPLPAPPPNPKMPEKDAPAAAKRDWNTSKLALRIGADALSAGKNARHRTRKQLLYG